MRSDALRCPICRRAIDPGTEVYRTHHDGTLVPLHCPPGSLDCDSVWLWRVILRSPAVRDRNAEPAHHD